MPAPSTLLIARAAQAAPGSADASANNAATLSSAEEITTAALAQIKGQDKLIQQLKASLEQQQVQLAALAPLPARLQAAEAAAAWLPWLVLVLMLVGAGAIFLGLRVRRLQQSLVQARWSESGLRSRSSRPGDSQAPGRQTVSPPLDERLLAGGGIVSNSAPMGLAPMVALQRASAEATMAMTRAVPPAPAPAPAPAPMAAPAAAVRPMRPADSFSLGTGVPPREVSVEELFDLEQQVDFFMVLGQEEAAIDLLVAHIRANGGSSPLPYLKLMEIYQQRDDEAGYERTRGRFNQRFSAQAPAFGGDLQAGRSLADYPEVVDRLQRLWSTPVEALVETELLMQAQEGSHAFDLPALRDLVLLNGMAADLLAQGATRVPLGEAGLFGVAPPPAEATDWRFAAPAAAPMAGDGGVDLLLPLDLPEPPDTTSPRPWLSSRPLGLATGERAPSPWLPDRLRDPPDSSRIDLDMDSQLPAPREFTRPAVFTDVDLHRDVRRSDFAALDEPPDPTRPPRPR